ncbi:MAG: rhodanese-like domain-containing protein [Solidesulfovibrio sp.]
MAHGAARRLPPLWLELAVICVLGAGMSVAMNMAREEPVPWVADFAAQDRREALRKGLETIDAHGGVSMLGKPGVVFIDARTAEEYSLRRVAGARNLPQEAMYGDLDAAAKALGLSAEDRLVVYCDGFLCDKSKELAEALRTAGYTYVTIMTDGFDGWLAVGGPTEGGA